MPQNTNHTYIQIHPADNVLVALADLDEGAEIAFNNDRYSLITGVAAKHKFTVGALHVGDPIFMYGVLVGKACADIPKGAAITTKNIEHASEGFKLGTRKTVWSVPEMASAYRNKTFMGYHRA